jgi:SAM-dependent methyltransferase
MKNFEYIGSHNHALDRDSLIKLWWVFHPRFKFFKTLKANSKLLDLGAGSGGLIFWREYFLCDRNDIEIYAVDIKEGEYFRKCNDFQICDLEKDILKWPENFFDAILISHVIEHIKNTENVMDNIDRVAKRDYALLYIEFPSDRSVNNPPIEYFLKHGVKVPRTITNFYDDKTHVSLFTRDALKALFMKKGFYPIEEGIISNPFIEDILIRRGIEENDSELFTYGIWSKLGFAEYVIFRRQSARNLHNILDILVKTFYEGISDRG